MEAILVWVILSTEVSSKSIGGSYSQDFTFLAVPISETIRLGYIVN
jgi:hypothetical protein